jgi:hypothetical protein
LGSTGNALTDFVALTEQHEAMHVQQSEMRAELARISAMLVGSKPSGAGE